MTVHTLYFKIIYFKINNTTLAFSVQIDSGLYVEVINLDQIYFISFFKILLVLFFGHAL